MENKMDDYSGFKAWLKSGLTDDEIDEIEKNWVKTAVECGDIAWLETFGYNSKGEKITLLKQDCDELKKSLEHLKNWIRVFINNIGTDAFTSASTIEHIVKEINHAIDHIINDHCDGE